MGAFTGNPLSSGGVLVVPTGRGTHLGPNRSLEFHGHIGLELVPGNRTIGCGSGSDDTSMVEASSLEAAVCDDFDFPRS